MVLDASFQDTQNYTVCTKVKEKQCRRKKVAPSPTLRCSSNWKESLRVSLDNCYQLYLIYIYIQSDFGIVSIEKYLRGFFKRLKILHRHIMKFVYEKYNKIKTKSYLPRRKTSEVERTLQESAWKPFWNNRYIYWRNYYCPKRHQIRTLYGGWTWQSTKYKQKSWSYIEILAVWK